MDFDTLNRSLSQLGGSGDGTAVLAFGRDSLDCWSFRKLDEAVERIASGLREKGLRKEEPVALLAPASPPYIAVSLGVLRAGGTVVPVDAQMSDKPLTHLLRDSRPRRLFTDERGARRLDKLPLETKPAIFRLDREEGDNSWRAAMGDDGTETETPSADDRAVLFYTSGTTGPPKGVPLSRANLTYQFGTLLKSGLIREGDCLLLPLPPHHVYPFVCGLLAPLHVGLPVVLPAALTGPQLLRAIRESESSVVLGVPRLHRALVNGIQQKAEHGGVASRLYFRNALALSRSARERFGWRLGRFLFAPLHRRLGGKVRLMASGGSQLDPNLARQLEAFGWKVAVGYGLTETSPLLTILAPGDPRFDTIGRPVPGTELKIDPSADPGRGNESGAGEKQPDRGEILARGPGIFKGYHQLTEETEKAFSGGWFRTGDLGRMDREGYLRVEGRVATMLVLESGENLAPETLEEIYADCEEIEEAGVLQREGKVVALLVPAESLPESEARTRIARAVERIGRKLPSYQRLSDFRLSSYPLPRTRLGKIRRHELADCYQAGDKRNDAAAPLPLEEMSADDRSLLDNERALNLWQFLAERYAGQRLDPDSRLGTDLGIDSLEWVELSGTVEERLGISLNEDVIERARTVHDLLEAAAGASTKARGAARQAIRDPESVLSENDRRWLKPRTVLMEALGRPLYWIHEGIMRALFRIEVRGFENLPEKGPYVLTPNHVSFLDGPALIAALPLRTIRQFFWAGLSERLFKNRFWRGISRLGQVVPIDPRRGPFSSLAFGAAVLKRGHPLIWFPEGGRSLDGELKDFRPGIGLILEMDKEVPVLPVHIAGTYAALPCGRRFPRPGAIVVHIGKPITPRDLEKAGEGDTAHQRITRALRDAVARLQAETGGETA